MEFYNDVGNELMREMIGHKYANVKLKRVNIAAPIATVSSKIKVGPKNREKPIDPSFGLFSKFVYCLTAIKNSKNILNLSLRHFPYRYLTKVE